MLTTSALRKRPRVPAAAVWLQCVRYASTTTAVTPPVRQPKEAFVLSRLSYKNLIRSFLLTTVMSSRWLVSPAIAVLGLVTNPRSFLLDPDRNPLLNRLLRHTIFYQFCVGPSQDKVAESVVELKNMGYQGVILTFAKEIVLEDPSGNTMKTENAEYGANCYEMIERWKEANLETLAMIGEGDFLAIKLTGAGPIAVDAIRKRQPIPPAVEKALEEICEQTKKQSSRLWTDAEQQALQPGIDDWTIELMSKYNRDGQILIYNTIQAYLKGAKANLDRHIALAAKDGWGLGVKLVRGAYIDHETRSLIHDTKEDTDRSYDLCADTLLSRRIPQGMEQTPFPPSALFLATHNALSARKAFATQAQRIKDGLPTAILECGQILGMADELSLELVQNHQDSVRNSSANKAAVPRVLKCLTWGSVGECMGFLHRRAIENRGAVERTRHMAAAMRSELRRRLFSRA